MNLLSKCNKNIYLISGETSVNGSVDEILTIGLGKLEGRDLNITLHKI